MIMDPRGFGRWRPQVPGNLPPGIYSNVVHLYVWLNTYFSIQRSCSSRCSL